MSMDRELTEKLKAYQDKVTDKAQKILFETFPQKILDLQALIDESSDPSSPFNVVHASSSTDTTVYPTTSTSEQPKETKKRKAIDGEALPTSKSTDNVQYEGTMYSNKHIDKMHEIIKKEAEELAQLCDEVGLWIQLTMPKIEDGDNFGVAVQEEALAELTRCQQSAYNLRDVNRTYHQVRGKICSKMIKYPGIEDYKLALKEQDEKTFFIARTNLYDLRNIYAVMTNIFQKNIAKIRAPKGNNSVGLY